MERAGFWRGSGLRVTSQTWQRASQPALIRCTPSGCQEREVQGREWALMRTAGDWVRRMSQRSHQAGVGGAGEEEGVFGRPLDVAHAVGVALEGERGAEGQAGARGHGGADVEAAHDAVLAAREQQRAAVRVDVQRVDLARVLAHLDGVDAGAVGRAGAQARHVVVEDLAVAARREHGRLALAAAPLDVADRQLVPRRAGARRGLARDQPAQVHALSDVEPVHADGPEDVPAG